MIRVVAAGIRKDARTGAEMVLLATATYGEERMIGSSVTTVIGMFTAKTVSSAGGQTAT
ncbi:MAG: hypothetical protein AB8B91_17095 [Rubripirellula sp.]